MRSQVLLQLGTLITKRYILSFSCNMHFSSFLFYCVFFYIFLIFLVFVFYYLCVFSTSFLHIFTTFYILLQFNIFNVYQVTGTFLNLSAFYLLKLLAKKKTMAWNGATCLAWGQVLRSLGTLNISCFKSSSSF